MKYRQKLAAILLVWTSLVFCALPAFAQSPDALSLLPGAEQWQPYLDQSPLDPAAFARDPLSALRQLFQSSFWETLRLSIRSCADTLVFLLLAAVLSLLISGTEGRELLELAAAAGCGVLLWGRLFTLADELCAQLEEWRGFLLGFLPVYAGVLCMGGETAAGTAASGFLLTALCFLAQCLAALLRPLLQCYLALSMTSCLCTGDGLPSFCKAVGKALRQALSWAGKAFGFLLGLQRAAAFQIDRAALRAGQLAAGSVPIVGDTLSDASGAILAAVQLLKSGLGFAAIGFLTLEFLPLYLGMLAQLALLYGCSLFCDLTEIHRCRTLFDCFAEAVRCMAAATALFFGLAVLGTALLFVVGGG